MAILTVVFCYGQPFALVIILAQSVIARVARALSCEADLKSRVLAIGRVCLGIAASALLGWLAVRGLDWGQVLEAFSGVSIAMITLSILVFLIASYLRAVRWRVLFIDGTVSVNRLFVVQNIGIGLNNVVPIRVASEAVQIAILTLRDSVRPSVAIATVGMERVLDLIVSAAILGVALILIPEMERFALYIWGAIGIAIISVVVVRILAWSSTGVEWVLRISFLAELLTAVKDLEREKTRLAVSTGVTFVYWLLVGLTAWLIADSISLSITLVVATAVIMGTIYFATAVPAAPAAIGTFEFAVVYVLEMFGVSRESGFGFAVITHAVFFLPPTIMAAVFLPREGIVSIGRLRSALAGSMNRQEQKPA